MVENLKKDLPTLIDYPKGMCLSRINAFFNANWTCLLIYGTMLYGFGTGVTAHFFRILRK